MGVLPLQLPEDQGWQELGMTGDENVTILNISDIKPRQKLPVMIKFADGSEKTVDTTVRIDTENEMDYFKHGGILHYVLRDLASKG
jgi:aconitate hydratase